MLEPIKLVIYSQAIYVAHKFVRIARTREHEDKTALFSSCLASCSTAKILLFYFNLDISP